jgi:hypothetical protein
MDLMVLKLDNVQSAVNIALANWHAELHNHPQPGSDQDVPIMTRKTH